jgi:hypothetical protein
MTGSSYPQPLLAPDTVLPLGPSRYEVAWRQQDPPHCGGGGGGGQEALGALGDDAAAVDGASWEAAVVCRAAFARVARVAAVGSSGRVAAGQLQQPTTGLTVGSNAGGTTAMSAAAVEQPAARVWDAQCPFFAVVAANQRLTPATHAQDTRHIELDIEQSGIQYQPGVKVEGVWKGWGSRTHCW